jgi:hypothetical protein
MNDKFHLEINSFADFVSFVALIRGKELDSAEIKSLVASLKTNREDLQKAIDKETKDVS